MKPWGVVSNQGAFEKHLFFRNKHTGSWLSVQGTTVTGTVLAAMEFSNLLCARYNFDLPNLQNKCNSCLQAFYVHHILVI